MAGSGAPILGDILIILALIIANGIFAGSEIAVISLRRTRVDELVEKGGRRARAIAALRAVPERFLATVQIGITVVGATAAAFGGADLALRLSGPIARLGIPDAHGVALAVVIGAISIASLIIGELVPKSLALKYAEGVALLIARPFQMLAWLMRPLVWALTGVSNLILGLFGDTTTFTESKVSPGEVQAMVDEAAKTGALDPRISEIASRAIDFGQLTVGEVMVPRRDIVALERRASTDEIQRTVATEGHSRIPVFEGALDRIVGYVIAKDVLALKLDGELLVLEDILRPVEIVPESKPAIDVLRQMQATHRQLTLVADEHGSISGLVTIDDLIEELVGDIFGEHHDATPEIRPQKDGSAIVLGTTPIRDVNRALGLELSEGEGYSTLGGLCVFKAGWIPQAGARLAAEDGTEFEILDASPRRVRLVRIRPGKRAEDQPEK